jgi:hypothetical protein
LISLPQCLPDLSLRLEFIARFCYPPIAKIIPLPTVNNEAMIGSMKGEITIHGDIFSTDLQWDAQS